MNDHFKRQQSTCCELFNNDRQSARVNQVEL